ncbi:uncharacterized protein L199_000366 [Kwoniella botswanensis]|uniref:uncharacterized protein n=1 Tax=Kwoniella botswanensis TaxID=1268659 RepID=UPI00315DED79
MDPTGHYPPTSSASSSTSFPIYHHPNPYHNETNATMYIRHNQSCHHHNSHFNQSQDSLLQHISPDLSQQQSLPSVQVTHPTPTKAMKFRRKSSDALSVSTASSFDPSPVGQMQLLPSPGTGTLDVMVENNMPRVPRSRPRSPELELEDDDSEAERIRLEEKQARIREKGRERQRRKRERDKKKAKEAEAANGSSSHLPVPSSSTQTKTPSQALSISVPSSVSSIASSLPQSASYFSISPSHPSFGIPTGSTSASGTSTPATLFSPADSTPGLGYSPDTSMSASLFSLGLDASMTSAMLEIPSDKPNKRNPRSKARAASTSVTSSANSRKVSPTPLLTGLPQPIRESKPPVIKSAKRRKSEPQTDELVNLGGLGVMTSREDPPAHSIWQTKSSDNTRPHPRRTASDGVVIKSSHDREREWGARSPTPPPVPSLPDEYRQNKVLRPSPSTDTVSDAVSAPSVQAEIFADRMVFLLNKDEGETGWLSNHIGLNNSDIDEMKNALKGVYDKWLLEKGMKEMSLDSSEGMGSQPSSASMTPSTTYMTQPSVPASPIINSTNSASGFFTPVPSRTSSRRGDKRPTITVPNAAGNSATSQTPSHTRQRSLSSASMMARGLHITSVTPVQVQQWSHPATPTLPQEGNANLGTDPRSDDTASPVNSSLQTPSTGQGSFPISDQMTVSHGHWRSATDPTGQRAYTTAQHEQHTPFQDPSMQQNSHIWNVPSTCPSAHQMNYGQLESPLATTAINKADQMGMPPPPTTSTGTAAQHPGNIGGNANTVGLNGISPVVHVESSQGYQGHQRHFSTPVTSRTQPISDRNIMAIPFTPETPVPVRGQNHTTIDGNLITSMPMWYNSTFMSHPDSQVLQSPIVERGHGHGHSHGHLTTIRPEHGQDLDMEMSEFAHVSTSQGQGQGQHGF